MNRNQALLVTHAILNLLKSLDGLYDTTEEGHDTIQEAKRLINFIGMDLEEREDW